MCRTYVMEHNSGRFVALVSHHYRPTPVSNRMYRCCKCFEVFSLSSILSLSLSLSLCVCVCGQSSPRRVINHYLTAVCIYAGHALSVGASSVSLSVVSCCRQHTTSFRVALVTHDTVITDVPCSVVSVDDGASPRLAALFWH